MTLHHSRPAKTLDHYGTTFRRVGRGLASNAAAVDVREPVTLAFNVADQYGKAAFDVVDPSWLIGWAEVGPGLLQSINVDPSKLILKWLCLWSMRAARYA